MVLRVIADREPVARLQPGDLRKLAHVNADLEQRLRSVLAAEHRDQLAGLHARAVVEAQRDLATAPRADRYVGRVGQDALDRGGRPFARRSVSHPRQRRAWPQGGRPRHERRCTPRCRVVAELWDRYDELLAGLPIRTPSPPEPGTRHARHLYQVLVEADARLTRDQLLDGLTARRIGTGVHYRGVHLHPFYRDTYGLEPADFPVATDISERTLSLPLGPKVTEADQDDVVSALRELLR